MRRASMGGAILCVFMGLALVPSAASAQTSGGSGFAGVVRDTSGAVLPGVTVEAASPALIEKVRTVVTDEKGEYKIVDLRPGIYTVTFSLTGFSSVRREAIELRTNFTASVNAELTVGTIEETLTVSGHVSDVDVVNVSQQTTLSRREIDALPSNREILAYASFIPAVITPSTAQDVGGSKGEVSVRMAIHGGKQTEQKLMQDGMRYNSMTSNGTARGFYVNPAVVEETVIETAAGGSAEFSTGGVQVNLIPKDGGNRFNGYFFTNYASGKWQSENLTSDLQARGLTTSNPIKNIYDVNGAFGGPIKKDTLWFYTAHRYWGSLIRVANLYKNATQGSFAYTPDLTEPAYAKEDNRSDTIRFTWQAARKHKITLSWDYQNDCICNNNGGALTAGTVALEAATAFQYLPDALYQATWTYPATNKLLFQAGATWLNFFYTNFLHDGATPETISIVEQTRGFTYNAPGSFGWTNSGQFNERFSMLYVTGSHNIKVGLFSMQGAMDSTTLRNPTATNYTFSNGAPLQLTEFASPVSNRLVLRPEIGLFAQDQWTVGRLTLNYGLRFEYLHSLVPANTQQAGRFIPERSFDKVDCVPCWKDLNPRAGVAYDLFGDGKTAVKASLGRYVASETVATASTFAPVNASINSVTRAWTDVNRNFIPDCDLTNPAVNGECQQISNVNFGKLNIVTNPDPDLVNGWGKRSYNWQGSVSVQRELRPGFSVNTGYFRTWYGNFTVTDNLSVTPADYEPYCFTAPVDKNLPGGGGNQICGLYDVVPSKFGLTNNVLTFAKNFGKQTEVYNGADVNFTARLPKGNLISGGWNIGNSISGSSNATTSSTRSCFVVDSPQMLYQCQVDLPYQSRFKVLAVYNLPWDLQTSANFQTLPGTPVSATYAVPTAAIQPSLGRPLAGGTRTAPVQLIAPFSQFEDRINQLDFRVARTFKMRNTRLKAMLDIYNLLNSSTILAINTTYGPVWRQPTQIMDARLIKWGVQVDF